MFDNLSKDEKEKLIKYTKWSGMVLLGSLFFLFLILMGMQDTLDDTEVIHNKPKTPVQAESESTFDGSSVSLWTIILVNILIFFSFYSLKKRNGLKMSMISLIFIIVTLLWALPKLFRDLSAVTDSSVQPVVVSGNSTIGFISTSTSSSYEGLLLLFALVVGLAVTIGIMSAFLRRNIL